MKSTLSKHTSLAGFLCIALFLVMSTFVRAQEASTTPNENRPDSLLERPVPQSERRVSLRSELQERIINLASNVNARLTAGTNRMTNIIDRINSRITKLKADGIDTSAAEAKLLEATNSLTGAQNALRDIEPMRTALTSDSPRERYRAIRGQYSIVREYLVQTRTHLHETVTLLKEARSGFGHTNTTTGVATTTATTSNSNNE